MIDAVAYVNIENTPWLLLIQVSFSEYKYHRSKVDNLKDKVSGCEKIKCDRRY